VKQKKEAASIGKESCEASESKVISHRVRKARVTGRSPVKLDQHLFENSGLVLEKGQFY
jgi:hypothetical protein